MVVSAAACSGCHDPGPQPGNERIEVVESFADPVDGWSLAGGIRFVDGARIEDVQVEPVPLVPGQDVSVRFSVSGPVAPLTVGLWPPRAASRQVALGGVDAPPVQVPVDPRARFVHVQPPEDGRVQVELQVPAPWHPQTAVLTLERGQDSTRYEAVRGARRLDGRAILGVVPVEARPTAVAVPHLSASPNIDGRLDDAAWSRVTAVRLVESLHGEPAETPDTQVFLGWDEEALYVAAAIDDPDLRTSFTRHDDPLWKEEALEVFVFGDARRQDYLELQISARGVTFDAKFADYRKGDESWNSAWQTAVDVQGTIDDPGDTDRGWTAELAIPWGEICEHTPVQCPPRSGMQVRANVFVLERPRKGGTIGLALSPTRVGDFHAPENAAILELTR